MERLGLRLRVFLFFAALAAAGVALAFGALWLAYQRGGAGIQAALLPTAIIIAFGFPGLCVGIWLLFDENVAKPIERLAAEMRSRAHAGVSSDMDLHHARYLGDLAPAAMAVTGKLNASTFDQAEAVAAQTAKLASETERLTALLTEIPVAMIIVTPNHKIVLYDGQAADILSQIAPPRLNASVFDYFEKDGVLAGYDALVRTGMDSKADLTETGGARAFGARLKPLGDAPGYMLIIDDGTVEIAPDAPRPLVYDFDLMERTETGPQHDAIDALCFVVFDTETTGLLPHRDEIVQIGAVRVLNGRIVPGESIDLLVHPGCPIPAASSRVHGITDAMVAEAPRIEVAGRAFHHFARDAVIVAHNAPFDMAFLRRHAGRIGVTWDHPILDTVLLSAVLFGASETHTLDALCDRLDVTIPEKLRHTALGDAQATAEVLCKMLPMLRARGLDTFGAVVAETRKYGRLLEDLN